jgi:predicted kinase
LALGLGNPFAVLLQPDDRARLNEAAEDRGTTAASLALSILRTVLRERLVDAV